MTARGVTADGVTASGVTLPDLAIALLADDGAAALGGALVVAPGAEEGERWVAALRAALAARRPLAPWRVVPSAVSDDRLVGGLDVVATLAAGARVETRGLLAEADGGVLVLPRAAAARTATLARVTDAIEGGRLAVVAVVCGDEERAAVPSLLTERLGLHVWLPAGYAPAVEGVWEAYEGDAPTADADAPRAPARAAVAALCDVADAFGIVSTRAMVFAMRVARALARAAERAAPDEDDLAAAVQLVLAPRAVRVPADEPSRPEAEPEPDPRPAAAPPDDVGPADAPPPNPTASPKRESANGSSGEDVPRAADELATRELLVAAARAALPPDLLDAAGAGGAARASTARGASGRAARAGRSADDRRGRRVGMRPGRPGGGSRLDLVETLRAAAPWQGARGRTPGGSLAVRLGDLRIERCRRALGTTTVVVVDASGSAALGRLAEAKGAAELLLAESYARRDQVALVAFRGGAASVLLPPTRALARARRVVSALPAGGGTPLAAALVAAADLARGAARAGARPAVVLLTDGRANVALDGAPGRERARADAERAARALAATLGAARGLAVVVDTAVRGGAEARDLAAAARGRYVALPHASAHALHGVVRDALADAPARRAVPRA
ncbi:hypothetical protein tb265_20390 [Gemmatimonadetes bacterium T265]|nr:hypothetical protein tb265_20390 [Gemmatimonadetes bacterium T265]